MAGRGTTASTACTSGPQRISAKQPSISFRVPRARSIRQKFVGHPGSISTDARQCSSERTLVTNKKGSDPTRTTARGGREFEKNMDRMGFATLNRRGITIARDFRLADRDWGLGLTSALFVSWEGLIFRWPDRLSNSGPSSQSCWTVLAAQEDRRFTVDQW